MQQTTLTCGVCAVEDVVEDALQWKLAEQSNNVILM